MRPARARRRRGFWLDLFACFLIPAYTMLFAGSVEWLGTNFSVIAVTGKDHYWGFVYWGALAGGYFAVMLTKLALILPRLWQRSAVCLLALLACLALSNAYASTPRHFLPYTADVSVPAHSAGSETPLVADRDDHREQMRQQRQLERRERMHRAEDRYQQGKMRQEQERMIREQRRTEREQARRNGQHWDNRDRRDSKWNDRDRDHPGRKHDKDWLERERRKDHQYNRHPQPRHDDGQYRPEELKRRGFDDGQYHPGR